MKVSMIVWKDHHSIDDWHDDPSELLGHCDEDPMISVGFVTAEDDTTVVLTGIVNSTQTLYGQSLGILKALIIKRGDIDLNEADDDADEYLVVSDDTSYADLFDPPDATTTGVAPV